MHNLELHSNGIFTGHVLKNTNEFDIGWFKKVSDGYDNITLVISNQDCLEYSQELIEIDGFDVSYLKYELLKASYYDNVMETFYIKEDCVKYIFEIKDIHALREICPKINFEYGYNSIMIDEYLSFEIINETFVLENELKEDNFTTDILEIHLKLYPLMILMNSNYINSKNYSLYEDEFFDTASKYEIDISTDFCSEEEFFNNLKDCFE